MGEEAEIEQILKRKPEQNQISGTAKEAMVRHRRNKEDARIQADAWRTGWKDLRQEWQMVTPTVLRECQGKNEDKLEIDYDQVDAIDTHDTFEFQNVLKAARTRYRTTKSALNRNAPKAYQTFNQER